MARRSAVIKAVVVLLVVWAVVWGIRSYAGSRKITAERVNREVAAAKFADWSETSAAPNAVQAERREKSLRNIAGLVNRLDFQEREKNRENRAGEDFFRLLSPQEKGLFVELTVAESMNSFMKALDAMKPEQRKRFVEQGLKEIENGRTQEGMERADAMSDELLEKISSEGMRAYFEKSTADTKLDLAPLMDAMNETMQGLRGNEFGPRSR
ncbi:MAG: hypothetical protein H8M99_01305 [Gloeobacteraceae cyanobacterium ES-bin-144]|nr:hypothetical protein [Verrucomicrobiales bacterium]